MKPPLMSICHPRNSKLCAPKASRNTTVPILPPFAVGYFEGNSRPMGSCVGLLNVKKARLIHGGLIQQPRMHTLLQML